MRRQRRHAQPTNHERWLVSYADFITLLFAFFVVLYSSSQVDQRKVGKLAVAIQVAFQELGVFQASTTRVPMDSAEPMPFDATQAIENIKHTSSVAHTAAVPDGELGTDSEFSELRAELEHALELELAGQAVSLRRQRDGLVISLREVGFFDTGSAHIRADAQPAFDRIANILRERGYRLRIEGHTDNVPIHTGQYASNWELSTARATELIRLLIVRNGFPPEGLSASGFAEFHPIASNRTTAGRAQNRRVDVVILSKSERSVADAASASQ